MRRGPRAPRGTFAWLALCGTAVVALTGCGGPAPDGYVAVGAAAPGPERGAGENVAPRSGVEFQPLSAPDAPAGSAGSPASSASSASSSTSASAPGSEGAAGSTPGAGPPAAPGGSATRPGTSPAPGGSPPGPGAPSGGPAATQPATPRPGTPGPATPTAPTTPPGGGGPATPAKLTLSPPARAAASDRWCERVTVTFTNTGGAAARSGTVTFATHIIGALGIDWATITTAQPLPAPIAGGAAATRTYTVCLEAWRVPLGMRVETRNVTATWS
ncbi:hypothetical protein ACFWJQ_04905 [Streptomyces goshikiensis]|uniref:hypothetical protein n=1 Tax=Streptomyces goshikiensis TaxID=1942 RepID=UPI00364B949F